MSTAILLALYFLLYTSRMQIAGVEITHPDKSIFPEQNITKQQIAEYYQSVEHLMLPFLKNRPVTLVRGPHGVGEGIFYQRHPSENFPDYIERVKIEGKTETEIYITIDALNDIIYLVNIGVIEFHAWGATNDNEDRPDWLVWDLDPGSPAEWPFVVEGAHLIKEVLDDQGLQSFVKLSGNKGVHVVLPIKPSKGWDEAKQFTLDMANEIVSKQPQHFTTKIPKTERVGKVFVDYLRNSKAATAVSPYSLRAKPGSGISMPISWEELGTDMKPNQFHVQNSSAELKKHPWAKFFKVEQSI